MPVRRSSLRAIGKPAKRPKTPLELAYYVPEPSIVLIGCRPLVPFHPGWDRGDDVAEVPFHRPRSDHRPYLVGYDELTPTDHFHAPEQAGQAGDCPVPRAICGICHQNIGVPHRYPNFRVSDVGPVAQGWAYALMVCWSDHAELDHYTYCEHCGSMDPRNDSNARAQRIAVDGQEAETAARRIAAKKLDAIKKVELSESHRREIWNGYRGAVLAPDTDEPELSGPTKIGRDFLKSIGQEPDMQLILGKRGKVIGRVAEEATT